MSWVHDTPSSAHMSAMQTMTAPSPDIALNRFRDRCDRCGAQAYVLTSGPDGGSQLTWCRHHFEKHEPALLTAGMVAVVDERSRLFGTEEARKHEEPHA